MKISYATLTNKKNQYSKDTPNTAGREGVNGRVKSQTVTLNFILIEMFVNASSSIMSHDPLSLQNSWNTGHRRSLFKDDVADFNLSAYCNKDIIKNYKMISIFSIAEIILISETYYFIQWFSINRFNHFKAAFKFPIQIVLLSFRQHLC